MHYYCGAVVCSRRKCVVRDRCGVVVTLTPSTLHSQPGFADAYSTLSFSRTRIKTIQRNTIFFGGACRTTYARPMVLLATLVSELTSEHQIIQSQLTKSIESLTTLSTKSQGKKGRQAQRENSAVHRSFFLLKQSTAAVLEVRNGRLASQLESVRPAKRNAPTAGNARRALVKQNTISSYPSRYSGSRNVCVRAGCSQSQQYPGSGLLPTIRPGPLRIDRQQTDRCGVQN